MLGLSTVRLYAYGALIVLAGLAYWRYTYVSNARDKAEAANTQLQQTLSSERKNRAIEQDDRRKADESVTSLQAELDRIRRPPDHPVSVYCRPARLPGAAGQGGGAAGADAPAVGGGSQESLRDIGAAMDAVRVEQQSNAARQRALIEWERSRSH